MPVCAFCEHSGKLSLEHIASEWMAELFPVPVKSSHGKGGKIISYPGDSLDFKARVVCKACNEGWMSEEIESKRAKPTLTPLITGKMGIPITQEVANSIAIFAFKTAVIVDCSNRDKEPFFSKRQRESFRRHLLIPPSVQMWMIPHAQHRLGVHIKTIYHNGKASTGYSFQMYVLTCAFGYFAFQVLAVKQFRNIGFRSFADFREDAAVPLWPRVVPGFVWPHRMAIKSVEEFDMFANRWQDVEIVGG